MSKTALPQGWMSKAEREWLMQRGARVRRCAVEIGSWKGRSTIALVTRMRPGVRLYAVDTWAGVPDDPAQHDRLYGSGAEAAYAEFKANLRWHIRRRVVVPMRMTSLSAAAQLARQLGAGSCDFVFIDADHRYEAVRADIAAWRPMVRRGGLLAGHDMHWEGVEAAVRELVPAAERGPDTIWYTIL